MAALAFLSKGNRMTLTREQTRALIEQCVAEAGGPSKFSRIHNVSEGQVRNVIKGRSPPGGKVIAACGVVKAEERWVKL